MLPSGKPFFGRISVILFNSLSSLLVEQIMRAQWTKVLIKLIFLLVGLKESQLIYKPVNVGFLYVVILNDSLSFL